MQTFDLVITDNQMPRLTGRALVLKVQQFGLDLPIIVATSQLDFFLNTMIGCGSPSCCKNPSACAHLRTPWRISYAMLNVSTKSDDFNRAKFQALCHSPFCSRRIMRKPEILSYSEMLCTHARTRRVLGPPSAEMFPNGEAGS